MAKELNMPAVVVIVVVVVPGKNILEGDGQRETMRMGKTLQGGEDGNNKHIRQRGRGHYCSQTQHARRIIERERGTHTQNHRIDETINPFRVLTEAEMEEEEEEGRDHANGYETCCRRRFGITVLETGTQKIVKKYI